MFPLFRLQLCLDGKYFLLKIALHTLGFDFIIGLCFFIFGKPASRNEYIDLSIKCQLISEP